jgi:hypothetical protein
MALQACKVRYNGRFQISDDILHLPGQKTLSEIARHERFEFVLFVFDVCLVEQVELACRIHHLKGISIFEATRAPDFAAIVRFHHNNRRTAGPAARSQLRIRVLDLCSKRLRGGSRHAGEIWSHYSATSIDGMARTASSLTVKKSLARLGVSRDDLVLSGCPAQTPDVGNQLPDLVGGQLGESWHLRHLPSERQACWVGTAKPVQKWLLWGDDYRGSVQRGSMERSG